MTDATPSPDLQAICDVCLQPIADGEGYVWVDQGAADTAARSTLPAPDAPQSLADFLESDDVTWHTTHTACHDMPSWAYTISVERIRTWPAYLHWCAHLMGKPWLKTTDWECFVLNSLEPGQAAISGLRPIRPQSLHWQGVGD
ncbi:MAG: hypothetical protein M3460_15740 [Actinomycetota bacterium]|nr:hypothetical protein [Actinomycetota bacterium]